ncbi:Na+/H+ antiporter NhaA [Ancylobacter sp.]|uniref:Na+/H+ antiporter NhaA n=1 Tax=Ancylobacter sp. TaxID=1872567 RepID=UPI003C7C5361
MSEAMGRLPSEPADWITHAFKRFLSIEALAGAILLGCTVIALILANTAWSEAVTGFWEMKIGLRAGDFEIYRSLKHWINDGLMTLFFFLIALELKRELVLGELRQLRAAALPLAAAVGGMVVPVAVFLLVMQGGAGSVGWGTVMSTDTAFVIGCLALLGSRVPETLRLFILSLAIFDDVGAILVVTIGYSHGLNVIALGAAGLGLATVWGVARLGVRSLFVYFALGGCIWLAFDLSGVHATLTGVLLGLMTPARSWVSDRRLHAILDRVTAYPPGERWEAGTKARGDLRRVGVAAREALSPIERLEIMMHPWVAFIIMPLFALANAGTSFGTAGFDPTLTLAIVAAFVIGKPAGVLLFSILAVRLRLAVRPWQLSWGLIASGSLLTGIGFAMALFIAELAFAPGQQDTVKLGILIASGISAAVGLAALLWVTMPRRVPEAPAIGPVPQPQRT